MLKIIEYFRNRTEDDIAEIIVFVIIAVLTFISAMWVFMMTDLSDHTKTSTDNCEADRGSLVIDGFSSDTLMVTKSYKSGDIIARTKDHKEVRIMCENYELLY